MISTLWEDFDIPPTTTDLRFLHTAGAPQAPQGYRLLQTVEETNLITKQQCMSIFWHHRSINVKTTARLNVQKRGWESHHSTVFKEEGCYSLGQK